MDRDEADRICVEAVALVTGERGVRDPKKAAEMFGSVADAGFPQGMFGLADLKLMGNGVPMDAKGAIDLYERAAALGNMPSAYRLGHIYMAGEYEDQKRCFDMFTKCAMAGFAYAYGDLGDCYYYGVGTPKDMAAAVRWYENATREGDPAAAFKLGCVYELGLEGVPKDEAKSATMFTMAAHMGVPEAQFKVGALMYDGKVEGGREGAAKMYELCKDAVPVAKFNLATMCMSGDGTPKDVERAFRLYLELADAGDPDAMFQVGKMYYEGTGVAKDNEESLRYFRKAANAGNEQAGMVVTTMLRQQNAQIVDIGEPGSVPMAEPDGHDHDHSQP